MLLATGAFDTQVTQFGSVCEKVAQLRKHVQDSSEGLDAPSVRRVECSILEQSVRFSVVEAQLHAVERLVTEVSSRSDWFADAQLGSEVDSGDAAEITDSVATPSLGLDPARAQLLQHGRCSRCSWAHRDILADRDIFLE